MPRCSNKGELFRSWLLKKNDFLVGCTRTIWRGFGFYQRSRSSHKKQQSFYAFCNEQHLLNQLRQIQEKSLKSWEFKLSEQLEIYFAETWITSSHGAHPAPVHIQNFPLSGHGGSYCSSRTCPFGDIAQWQRVRFACGRPRVQTPVSPTFFWTMCVNQLLS